MDIFPRTQVEGLSLPRMIIGTNWMLGYSHRTPSADQLIRDRYSDKKVFCDTLCTYLEYGIDAMMAPFVGIGGDGKPVNSDVMMDGIHMAEDKMGRKITLIDTPIIDVTDSPEAYDKTMRQFEAVRANGADICLIHHSSAEQLVCKQTGTINRLEKYTKMIRDCHMIPGLSAHMPELVIYSDNHPEYDVQTYIQIYNCLGFLMQIEVEGVRRIIENAKHPVMTIKSMAAGRCTPYVGLTFSFASLREQDMVTVGAHTADEAREDIEIALAAIERRYPEMGKRNSPNMTTVLGGK